AEAAERLAERGQSLFRRIEDLTCPSIAVVNGACMGGGLELALACDHLIAVHGDKTRLALPEIKIGIHPGFGGCVRLPRRVGWLKATDMILTGRAIDSKKSKRTGLADISCHVEQVEAAIVHLATRGKVKRTGMNPWWMHLWPARALFFQQVKKRAMARFKHLDIEQTYPAIPAAIRLLEEIAGEREGQAYAREAESLGKMAITPTCKNLIHVFHLGEGLKKQEAVKKGRKHLEHINHVAVFGAGVMGSGIAWVAAKSADVDLHDVAADALSRGMKALSRFARRDAKRMSRIRPVLDRSGLADSRVVIEAVLEDIKIKNALWKEVESQAGKEALLLSNTSSLSVSDMQKALKHPGRMAGMHFFNPAPKMPLVEVVAGAKTTKRTLETVAALAAGWGKYPVIVADKPGFLVNRCLMPYMAAALHLLEKGQRPEHVDGALKHFGMPMGAFELADRVGLDICRHVGDHLSSAFGAHQAMPDWFASMVDDGLLGEKSGSGFFAYAKGKRGGLNPELSRYVELAVDSRQEGTAAGLGGETQDMEDAAIVDACLLPMLAEALTCLHEKVVDDPDHLDAAIIYGIGFPPFRGGLLHYFATQNAKDLQGRMAALGLKLEGGLKVLEALAHD
ncbi:MAG: 3-hydroxyacyl-CoA dehydrogenase NAD-binding domain-containing protein, partial [Mariprofundaceae bacterium]|nr:3-hydroxyacyl-CoA dehydrogenase NAD-binding domain-containing protein [Mariprofundaceae bacterium]